MPGPIFEEGGGAADLPPWLPPLPALPAGMAVQALCPGSCAACPQPAQLPCMDDPNGLIFEGILRIGFLVKWVA